MNTATTLGAIAGWLLTVALHGTVLLAGAWLVDRRLGARLGSARELLWRVALFGGVITATLQVLATPLPHWWQTPQPIAPGAAAPTQGQQLNQPMALATEAKAVPRAQGASALVPAPTSAATHGVRFETSTRWPVAIFSAWLFGVLVAAQRIARSLRQLRRALQRATALDDCAVKRELAALAQQRGIGVARAYRLDEIPSPLAASGGRIFLPAWAIESLDLAQLRAMLAHELAHIARNDPQWRILTACWRALFWFLPLTAIAQRRLEELAELACDAFAVQHTGSAHAVAECLAACAEQHAVNDHFRFAPAMAVRESSFFNRIERLLEGGSMKTFIPGPGAHALALLLLVAATVSLPTITLLPAQTAHAAESAQAAADGKTGAAPAKPGHTGSHINISDDDHGHSTMTLSISDDGHQLSVRADGKLAFTADESDVASVGAGGSATFEETRGGVTHRIEFADRNGKLERRYFVNRNEQPFDAAGQAWLRQMLPSLIRETGIGADARVDRLYKEGGAARVLDEIDQIQSDYVRGLYLGLLLDRGTLAPAELNRALQLAGKAGSDYERRQALSHIVLKQALSPAQQVTFLQQALHFDSDYERAELLIDILPKLANTPEVRQAWLTAGLGVKSDYERRRTLEALLAKTALDDSQLGSILDASASMRSDYEHRELLVAVARRAHDIDALAPAYLRSAQSISSDYERREALLALIHAGKLSAGATQAVLDSAAKIGSDYECREVLVALAGVMPNDAASVQRYRDVAGRLSAYERGEAEQALRR